MPNRIFVTNERCTGCTACAKVCPVNCIDMPNRSAEDKAKGVKWPKVAVIDEVKCIFCGACVKVCDDLAEKAKKTDLFHAITMEKEVIESAGPAIDPTQFKGVWCYAEVRHGKLVPTVYELLTVAGILNGVLKEEISVVLIGHQVSQHAQEIIEHGADKVYVIDHPVFENFVDEAYCAALTELIKREKPNKLLLPASTIGRSFASRVAITANTGITADATEFAVDPKTRMMHATRPSFGGNLMATILCEKHRPEMATVRPMSFARAPRIPGRQGKILKVTVDPATWNIRAKFKQYVPEQSKQEDITSAEKIVSGGLGLGKADGFKLVEELADVLGAAVGASRAVVDKGWIPYRHQVGLTGRTVRPKLYIACGISGAIQHLAGMSSSEFIVAINRDPNAPLMSIANLAVEGDLYEILPALTKELKALKS
ncbi:MAG TPA: FAD-binding protein [Elusimicrobiota bacterium]|nr:FAD-binding protein [Elusimicrobiota bacterium]